MPTVTYIVPAYNASKTIRKCIQSILDQTYTDYELLVMDDGSTDETPQILDEMAARDARIRVVHKANSGVSDTRNQALALARGEYIQFLDADDWIAPMATAFYIHAMEDHPSCDMVISDFYRVVGDKLSRKYDISDEKLLTRLEYAQAMMRKPADFYYGVLWNKFYRRSIIENNHIRMDTQLSWSEDFIFNMEYVLHADYIYVLRYPTYYYVKTEGSLVATQGASFSKTVQMKHAVIEYYTNFYKNIYKDGGYLRRTPAIYAYLLDSAHDGGVNRIAPDGTLSHNPMDVAIEPEKAGNPFVFAYYQEQLQKEMIQRLEKGHELDEKDAKILLYLKLADTPVSMTSIRNYTGLSQTAASSSLQKLTRREITKKIKPPKNAPEPSRPATLYTFGDQSAPIREAIDHVIRDTSEIQLQGLSQEEQTTFKLLCQKVAHNIRTALRGE